MAAPDIAVVPVKAYNTAFNALAAVTAIGASDIWHLKGAHALFALQVTLGGAVPATTVVVNLEGSLNGTDWFTIGTWTLGSQASKDIVFVTGKPVHYVRANLATFTGGTSPTVSAWISAL